MHYIPPVLQESLVEGLSGAYLMRRSETTMLRKEWSDGEYVRKRTCGICLLAEVRPRLECILPPPVFCEVLSPA